MVSRHLVEYAPSAAACVRGLNRVRLHADLTVLAKLSCALASRRAVPLAAQASEIASCTPTRPRATPPRTNSVRNASMFASPSRGRLRRCAGSPALGKGHVTDDERLQSH